MKKSELKSIIKEALVEVLPEVLNEILTQKPAKKGGFQEEKIDLVKVFSESRSAPETPYDFDGEPRSLKSYAGSVPAPNNPKGEVRNGEKYASGKGILEWFAQSKGVETKEHIEKQNKDVDGVISNIMGRKK
jgi:hypothetical protein